VLQEPQQQNLLLIEKHRKLEICFNDALQRKGYSLLQVNSGGEGLVSLNGFHPDVIVINAASLRTNGLRICSWYHNRLPTVPIILIVAEDEPIADADWVDVIMHLPFTVQKLVNRLRSFEPTLNHDFLVRGVLQLNPKTRMVTYFDKSTYLTPRLTLLLRVFMENPLKPLTREELFKRVWETDYTEDTRTLDVHISWLRKVLEIDSTNPRLIKTVRGVGYMLNL
jgi:DNA-binding response OmpR family regulator